MTKADAEILGKRIGRWRMWGVERTGEELVAGLMRLERPEVADLAGCELVLATCDGEPVLIIEG